MAPKPEVCEILMLPDFDIPDDLPVLIAGPTASGKSELAMRIAQNCGGAIINADALQVYDGWRILTARPTVGDQSRVGHHLYGHVPYQNDYSVGHWLRAVIPLLAADQPRAIIVGGTGLYFRALTEGLADIPPPGPDIRARADDLLANKGLGAMLDQIDAATRSRIDTRNPKRVQRAWEVLNATNKGLADWQDETPPGALALKNCLPILINPRREILNERITRRFHGMIDSGVLDEVRAMAADWDPTLLSSKAIGAPELIAHIQSELSLDDAIEAAIISTRQFAKRQRTWFRARMSDWSTYNPE